MYIAASGPRLDFKFAWVSESKILELRAWVPDCARGLECGAVLGSFSSGLECFVMCVYVQTYTRTYIQTSIEPQTYRAGCARGHSRVKILCCVCSSLRVEAATEGSIA